MIKGRFYVLTVLLTCSGWWLLTGCSSKPTPLFTALPSSQTNIDFNNRLQEKPQLNILYFLYYYDGGGVATGDINNDGYPDIYFTANSQGANKLYVNKGRSNNGKPAEMEFEDITTKAGVAGSADWCSGVTMADVNADGWLDIYVCAISQKSGLEGHNELFINNHDGTFTEKAAEYGLALSCYSNQAAFFDYDHDGDLDCYLLNQSDRPFLNLVDTSNRRKYDKHSGDILLRNDVNTATKKFTDVSATAGIYQSNLGYGLGLAVADVNNDGWDDIYVGNDFHENDYYYVNKGDGTFEESGAKHFRHYSRFSMGNDIADYNNDGQLDIVNADMLPADEKILKTYGSDENPEIYNFKIIKNGYQPQYSKNSLQRNNGNGESFSEVSLISGMAATDWSWSPLLADFDNDGYKDLLITSGIVKRTADLDYVQFVSGLAAKKGNSQTDEYDKMAIEKMPDGSSHPFLFKGLGDAGFKEMSTEWGTGDMKGYFNGAAYADFDNDGDLDVVMNCINAKAVILENNSSPKNYLSISFKGAGSNSFGIGAKAYVFAGKTMQYQQLMLTRGFQSAGEARLHFGFDSSNAIDSVLVIWPGQQYQVIRNVKPNQQLQAEERNAAGQFIYNNFFAPPPTTFTNVSAQVNCNWKHAENSFNDFNFQYLIPHKQSTRGPKLAVADVNKDGLDDFFVCGANGQPGTLMLQTKMGQFVALDTAVFSANRNSEEVDAIFFDADKNGYPDLYVVSGGNEYADGNPALADKLYHNDGNGHFKLTASFIPSILTNKSCVAAADVDNDGDEDLFVGGLADAKKFGLQQASYLLINNGKGNFITAPASTINLSAAGIVTGAVFADVNQDKRPDLVITGEWMPVKIYLNTGRGFKETIIPASTGLWQTIFATDVNGDGFQDLLAGNWGHNTKLFSGKQGPLKMFVKDFDRNGAVEQVMTYRNGDKDYTFLGKDELERSLPVLKKVYLTYGEVAGETVDYMFYDLFNNYTELKAEVLGSSCFINDGKGNFSRIDLPGGLQQAPVFSFASGSKGKSFIAAGNFYGVMPYEGRYDALCPTLFSFDQAQKGFAVNGILNSADGEARDLKWINHATLGRLLVMASNNKELVFLKPAE